MKLRRKTDQNIKDKIQELKNLGRSKRSTAKELDILWSTVQYWWDKHAPPPFDIHKDFKYNDQKKQPYVYLLGLYLGDGHIAQTKRKGVYRLCIYQDPKYPKLAIDCQQTIAQIFPNNVVSVFYSQFCNVIRVYSSHLVQYFPQHGHGQKHRRKIQLEHWQQTLVDEFPFDFIKGLIYSDGSYCTVKQGSYMYDRFTFTNKSVDIMNLFKDTCRKVGIHSTAINSTKTITTNITRHNDVKLLKQYINAKC